MADWRRTSKSRELARSSSMLENNSNTRTRSSSSLIGTTSASACWLLVLVALAATGVGTGWFVARYRVWRWSMSSGLTHRQFTALYELVEAW